MNILQSPLRTPLQSAQEYGRGLAGGLIFSLPLLFTQEVWRAGWVLSPGRMACYVAVTLGVLLLYNRFAGLREGASWLECAVDSVEEMGLGLVLTAFVLWLNGQIDGAMSASEIGGKIIMGAMTAAIGVSVGTAQLGAGQENSEADEEDEAGDENQGDGYLKQCALALCGAILIGANIAPTEEALLVAKSMSAAKLLLLALFSLSLSAYVLFFAEFRGASPGAGTAFEMSRAVISTYAIALAAAAAMLFFFGRFDGETFATCLAETVVVGLAATLGASAGRLLLQSNGDQ